MIISYTFLDIFHMHEPRILEEQKWSACTGHSLVQIIIFIHLSQKTQSFIDFNYDSTLYFIINLCSKISFIFRILVTSHQPLSNLILKSSIKGNQKIKEKVLHEERQWKLILRKHLPLFFTTIVLRTRSKFDFHCIVL